MKVYLGIDVGSVTTKIALVDEQGGYVDGYMTRTAGQPVIAVQKCLDNILSQAKGTEYEIMSVGTTGSGRNLAGALVGADVIKNEITAHAVAASSAIEGVQTTVTGLEGNIATLQTTANAITGRVENAEGEIGALQLRADGFETRFEDAEGNISNISQTADEIGLRVGSIET